MARKLIRKLFGTLTPPQIVSTFLGKKEKWSSEGSRLLILVSLQLGLLGQLGHLKHLEHLGHLGYLLTSWPSLPSWASWTSRPSWPYWRLGHLWASWISWASWTSLAPSWLLLGFFLATWHLQTNNLNN